MKLAKELWGDRFEVVVSTHLDKQHLHNHFVLNSVSFKDGKRYYDNNATYALMRRTSDRLCREHALSVIENPQRGKSKHYAEWKAEQEGKPTWRGLIREDVDKAIAAAMTFTQFIAALRKEGYEVKTGVKHLAVRPLGKERFVRMKTLGDDYTEEAIKRRILQNRIPQRPPPLPEPRRKRCTFKGHFHTKSKRKLTGLQALYFHYLYKMGILPKPRASPRRTHFLLREDLRYLNELTAQTKLLCKNHISSKEQLFAYRSTVEQEMSALSAARKSLYNRIRRCGDEGQVTACKEQIAGLTRQISQLRKEVKLCTGILSRSGEMQKKLSQVHQAQLPAPGGTRQRPLRAAFRGRTRKPIPIIKTGGMIRMKMSGKTKRVFAVCCALALLLPLFTVPAYAANDPLTVVNNLSEFIFGLIRAIGMILLGFGIVQIGLSLKSHDPSQRANGFLTLAGGVIITFAKEILNLITGKHNGNHLVCRQGNKTFFSEMLTKTRNNDAYHRAFFYAMGICAETRRNIHALFDSRRAASNRRALRRRGRRAEPAACAVWPSTSGMAGRRKEKKTVPLPTSCLTAASPPTFLKPSGCAIPNIAEAWNAPRPIFLQRRGSQ